MNVTINIHDPAFSARLIDSAEPFALVDVRSGDAQASVFLTSPAKCDALIKAAALAKSMLSGETSEPLPVLAEPSVSAQWAAKPVEGRVMDEADVDAMRIKAVLGVGPDPGNPERTATPAEHADTAERIERARNPVVLDDDAYEAEQLARHLQHGGDR